jgi:cellulose synthase/poly-beta-1,6-N-acetylglucosamine synthase-like glycosyltransferase
MTSFFMTFFYVLSFLSLYVQVFLLFTYIENRKKIKIRKGEIELDYYPTVSIVVPCYNEENTVSLTIDSLLNLNYPEDKLEIMVVDDGSIDNTWQVLQKYKDNNRIKLFKQKNGGKHTALNFGLEKSNSEFIGGLDADSSVDPEALKRIITYFKNEEIVAVAPSIIVRNPKNIIQYAQHAEYDMSHYNKKTLALLNGINVTPGPFSIFRKELFNKIGKYRKAHQTEDQEIALRIHEAGYKIEHCPDAYVYTNSPNTIKKLYKQRTRWIYGFIQNARDYKNLFFRPKYGTIGLFTLPSGIISVFGTVFLLFYALHRFYNFFAEKFTQVQVLGFDYFFNKSFTFDLFFINTEMLLFVTIILYALVIIAVLGGRSMIAGKKLLSWDILIFTFVYTVLAPFWLMKAIYNVATSKEASWVEERNYGINKI